MSTVVHKELHNLWGGKVIVDEVRQFSDERGMLCELWRNDDDKEATRPPVMSYWSVTNSFVMRGPHEHKAQCDWFVTWFNRMVYQLYNPDTNEMFHFITDPSKIYRVKVDVGIIHSYRNLETRPVTTGNFPSALFMGEGKKSPIDEIRHEEKLKEDLTTYVVLGAGGRLGKAVVDLLYKRMGLHEYHVLPYYDKINNKSDIDKLFDCLTNAKPRQFDPTKIKILNCAALTNVQKLTSYTEEVNWANVGMPTDIASKCELLKIPFYQISSDYVFRVGDDSVYTRSKSDMEHSLRMFAPSAHIVRVANLFSLDVTDTHNIVSKLKSAVAADKDITYDPNQKIFPTSTTAAAWAIIEFMDGRVSDDKDVNIVGSETTVFNLCKKLNHSKFIMKKSNIEYNYSKFLNKAIVIDTQDMINEKLTQ